MSDEPTIIVRVGRTVGLPKFSSVRTDLTIEIKIPKGTTPEDAFRTTHTLLINILDDVLKKRIEGLTEEP